MLTDVHLPEQCAPAAEVVDVLQIPAFLCRQTDLLVAAGATGKPVNVKKGQWMHPEGMRGAVDKVRGGGATIASIAVTERGTFFGYGDLVVDMRSFARMREAGGGVLGVDDHELEAQAPAQMGQMVGEALAARAADDVAEESKTHSGVLSDGDIALFRPGWRPVSGRGARRGCGPPAGRRRRGRG